MTGYIIKAQIQGYRQDLNEKNKMKTYKNNVDSGEKIVLIYQ